MGNINITMAIIIALAIVFPDYICEITNSTGSIDLGWGGIIIINGRVYNIYMSQTSFEETTYP